MSWCDKLASTPGVGFTMDAHFSTGNTLLEALSPLMTKYAGDGKQTTSVDRLEPLLAVFSTDEGFQYGAEPTKVYVGFQHKMKIRAVSGGPPTMEMVSRPEPYTKLLPEVASRLSEATLLMPSAKTRNITKVGIVSSTGVAFDEIPPGIARFVSYMGRPWSEMVESFNFRITAKLNETSAWSDKCVHTLIKPDDPEELCQIHLDWQRSFSSGRAITAESVKSILAAAQKDALKYFEDLAEGSRFDEDILASAT